MLMSRLPHVLFITSYPPRECGIATYSKDLITALENKFGQSFIISICALEEGQEHHAYAEPPLYVLDTTCREQYSELARKINENNQIELVLVQHEFGFFRPQEAAFEQFIADLNKPLVTVFHTVLPNPNPQLRANVIHIAKHSASLIVMTGISVDTLARDYDVPNNKVTMIPHGTHLVKRQNRQELKEKYGLTGRKVLSTFGLLSSGKGIGTTLDAMPAIVAEHPDAVFLIIGKTHPGVVKQEGERYRESLMEKVEKLGLHEHVRFVNRYLELPELLGFLQMTDVYLFTSTDPGQAVSGTFSYAMSCGCPVVSTPIPHAREVLTEETGIFFDFGNAQQLSEAVNGLLMDDHRRGNISLNGLHRMASTIWENTSIGHALLFEQVTGGSIGIRYCSPPILLDHLHRMTTPKGIIQFSKLDTPDITSGFTLDDNARALVTMCQHFELTADADDLPVISTYLNFMTFCQQPDGSFLNYVDEHGEFTAQNHADNLEDANGRAIWALGHLLSLKDRIPAHLTDRAEKVWDAALPHVEKVHSSRAMGFIIKGLYYHSQRGRSASDVALACLLAGRLVQMYRHEADEHWHWFESYLTYANSILSEALLCAFELSGEEHYREIATLSFTFLLSKIFSDNGIRVVSNRGWMHRSDKIEPQTPGGEQPIDVAYTILALDRFHTVLKDPEHLVKLETAFAWFHGHNHLQRIIYNPCTGGCHDGLEEHSVNLNQGAESTLSYLMARLAVEKYRNVPSYPGHFTMKWHGQCI